MKVILLQAVTGLGEMGAVKEVKKGYAFNYLLPEGLVELATAGRVKSVEALIARRTAEQAAKIAVLSTSMQKLDGMTFTIVARAEEGKLFGSVSAADIVTAAKESDVEILDDMIRLERPIKTVGEHAVTLEAGKSKAVVTVSVVAG